MSCNNPIEQVGKIISAILRFERAIGAGSRVKRLINQMKTYKNGEILIRAKSNSRRYFSGHTCFSVPIVIDSRITALKLLDCWPFKLFKLSNLKFLFGWALVRVCRLCQ